MYQRSAVSLALFGFSKEFLDFFLLLFEASEIDLFAADWASVLL